MPNSIFLSGARVARSNDTACIPPQHEGRGEGWGHSREDQAWGAIILFPSLEGFPGCQPLLRQHVPVDIVPTRTASSSPAGAVPSVQHLAPHHPVLPLMPLHLPLLLPPPPLLLLLIRIPVAFRFRLAALFPRPVLASGHPVDTVPTIGLNVKVRILCATKRGGVAVCSWCTYFWRCAHPGKVLHTARKILVEVPANAYRVCGILHLHPERESGGEGRAHFAVAGLGRGFASMLLCVALPEGKKSSPGVSCGS